MRPAEEREKCEAKGRLVDFDYNSNTYKVSWGKARQGEAGWEIATTIDS